ncbi:hypothetical protein OJ998_04770 [Solirubrobacter taibaiensis]|nr:hypothetical protein [Solirubrobacter taibaiensis]
MAIRPRAVLMLATVLVVVLSLVAAATASAQSAPPITPGAKWQDIPDLGVTGSHTYMYTPSALFDPAPMLTPVLFVYSNTGYASQDAAWTALSNAGLVARAEADHAVLIVQNPVAGGVWSAADLSVYDGVMHYIWGANTAASGKPALSYYRLNYLVGEGAGASFINQYMTVAPQVYRVAGVATFGGAMPDVTAGSAVPAYLVGASDKAVSFYKGANGVNRTSGANTFYNSANEAKQVIVSGASNTSFDRALLDDAYESLFRYTTRQALTTAVYQNNGDTIEDFTLMQRPNLAKLNLTQRLVSGADTGTTGQPRWYEWIPNEVLAGMESGSTKKYPLVIDLHGGGDHEIYEAESNGWMEVAGTKKVIVVAPFDGAVTPTMNMLAAIKAKYPVDLSRIYVTGFSRGAAGTWALTNAFPDQFAGVAPMSSPSGNTNLPALPQWNDKIDLPMWFSVNSIEYAALDKTQTPYRIRQFWLRNLNTMMDLNGIKIPPLNAIPWTTSDFVTYPLYGFPIPEQRSIPTKWGFPITVGTLRNAYGIPLMELAAAQGLEHTHYMPLAGVAWDFLSKYSRDPVTKELHILTETPASGSVGGTVPATLSLTLGSPAQLGTFTPGVTRTYEASTSASVTSTAGDATLSVSDSSGTATGHLVNGAFSLPQFLQARARNATNTGTAFNNVGSSASPLNLLTYGGPVSNDQVSLQFSQLVNSTDPLRTGAYSKALTFTLSTTTP